MNAKILLLLLQADFGEVVVEVRLVKRENNQKRILGKGGREGRAISFRLSILFCFVSQPLGARKDSGGFVRSFKTPR
jgi:hypothetical protein